MRRQRIIIAGMILLLVGLVAIVAAQSENVEFNDVTARRLLIVNDAGERKVLLGAEKDDGFLVILNDAGDSVAHLGSLQGSGGLIIKNKTGEVVVYSYADIDGNGAVRVTDRDGRVLLLEPGPRWPQ